MNPKARENVMNARSRRHAKERQQQELWQHNRAERKRRTAAQQIVVLDFRLGKGQGAKKSESDYREE